jgi:flagellar basal-body rod protein FlgB
MVRRVNGLIERPDGNNVSLDREGMLLAQTQLQYKGAIELIRAEFRRLLGAINDGKES